MYTIPNLWRTPLGALLGFMMDAGGGCVPDRYYHSRWKTPIAYTAGIILSPFHLYVEAVYVVVDGVLKSLRWASLGRFPDPRYSQILPERLNGMLQLFYFVSVPAGVAGIILAALGVSLAIGLGLIGFTVAMTVVNRFSWA